MNLDDIAAGSLCVVDTNVLIYAEQGVSPQAQRFVRRCSSGEIKAVLPQTVWQELTHKLMLAEAMMRGLTSGDNPAARLGAKPEAIRGLTLYRAKVSYANTASRNCVIAARTSSDLSSAMRSAGVLPSSSFCRENSQSRAS